jgi:diketogulonate reductase-like aldo/keto reductase
MWLAPMNERAFGSLRRLVPLIGQGTWNFPTRGAGLKAARVALRAGIELGMTHIDTAEMYGDGVQEENVGSAIRGFPRDQLFIVSKVLPSNASRAGVLRACEGSLQRMGLDYLDCYLLHWRGNIALAETMSVLEELVEAGKIRSLGVSNFDVEDLDQARAALRKHRIVCNQVYYALDERGIERRLLPYCIENKIAVVGYSPLGSGAFPTSDSVRGRVLMDIARRRNATPQQMALAFLLRFPGTFVIPKAINPAHQRDNARAGDMTLTAEEIASIDRAFPLPENDAPLAMI